MQTTQYAIHMILDGAVPEKWQDLLEKPAEKSEKTLQFIKKNLNYYDNYIDDNYIHHAYMHNRKLTVISRHFLSEVEQTF